MYHNNINSILDYYSSVGRRISGTRSKEEIFEEVKGFLNGAIPCDMSGMPPRKKLLLPEEAQVYRCTSHVKSDSLPPFAFLVFTSPPYPVVLHAAVFFSISLSLFQAFHPPCPSLPPHTLHLEALTMCNLAQTYIKTNLQPFLVKALAALARSKPKEPLKFLATWLIENNPNNPKTPTANVPGEGGGGAANPVGVQIVGDTKSKVITRDEK